MRVGEIFPNTIQLVRLHSGYVTMKRLPASVESKPDIACPFASSFLTCLSSWSAWEKKPQKIINIFYTIYLKVSLVCLDYHTTSYLVLIVEELFDR